MSSFTESIVEQAALAWFESLGGSVRHGLEIAPGEPGAERTDSLGKQDHVVNDVLIPFSGGDVDGRLDDHELRLRGNHDWVRKLGQTACSLGVQKQQTGLFRR